MHIRLFITALSKTTKGETKPNVPYEGLVKLMMAHPYKRHLCSYEKEKVGITS